MKLYDAERAPSPRRVRIFLAEKGVAVERVMIDLRAGEQLGDRYLAINPRGVVPALETDDGAVICESSAICRYIEALHPDPPMFGRTAIEIGAIEEWTRRIENDGYAAVVYAYRNANPAFAGRAAPGARATAQIPELAARGIVMWQAFVTTLDQRLRDRDWIATDGFGFADIAALVTIDFARAARFAVPDVCRAIARWHAAASARPSAGA